MSPEYRVKGIFPWSEKKTEVNMSTFPFLPGPKWQAMIFSEEPNDGFIFENKSQNGDFFGTEEDLLKFVKEKFSINRIKVVKSDLPQLEI